MSKARIDPDLLPQPLPLNWVPGEGLHLGAMVVGEAPGEQEWEQKRPFVGRSGQLLRSELKSLGVESDQVYITNVVKIWPRDARGKTRPPSIEEIESALPYLQEEIQHVVPRYILALGNQAFRTLVGTDLNISLYRGFWYRLDERFDWEEALVLATYHPAFVLRNMSKMDVWRRDLKEFVDVWRGNA